MDVAATVGPGAGAVRRDPWARERRLNALDRELREWAGVVAAGTAAMVGVIDRVDAEDLWSDGFRSLEQWVTLRCGVSSGHARRLVGMARALRDLPLVAERFAAGAASEDAVTEVVRAGVTAFHDHDAAQVIESMTVAQFRTALSVLPPIELLASAGSSDPAGSQAVGSPVDGPLPAAGTSPVDGTSPADGTSPVDDTSPVDGSLSAAETSPAPGPADDLEPAGLAGSAVRAEPAGSPESDGRAGGDSPPPAAAGTDEWVRFGPDGRGGWGLHARLSIERGALVEVALAAARDREYRERHGREPDPTDPPVEIGNVDALVRLAGEMLDAADPATRNGGAPSDRYMVNVHLQPDSGAAHLHLGPRLPRAVRDEVCCDAEVRGWLHGADGSVGLGRRARVVSPRLRLAVEHRDGGCVIPGCGNSRHLRIHHVVHWVDGGATDTANLVALCPRCHTAVHRGELTVSGNPDVGTLQVGDRQGRPFSVGHPTPPDDEMLTAATLRATASPWRAGEHVQWKWFDWTPPESGILGRPRPPDRPPGAAA